MGFNPLKTLGSVWSHANPVNFALSKIAPAVGHTVKNGVSWLGKKPEGAEEVNDRARAGADLYNDPNDYLNEFTRNQHDSLFGKTKYGSSESLGNAGSGSSGNPLFDRVFKNGSTANPSPGGGTGSSTGGTFGQPPKKTDTYNQYSNLLGDVKGYQNDLGGRLGLARERSDAAYNDAYSRFSNFADTGGWSDSDKNSINENVGRLKSIGKYGARDEAEANRVRGNGVYDEFTKTGGISESDKANIRARGNSVGTSIFDSLKRGLSHGQALSGGANPGYDAQSAKMARDSAHAANDASLDTELGLSDKINSGRQWGAQGVTSAEQQLIANMLAGNTQAGSQEMSMINSINQGKQYGTSGIADLYRTPGADLAYENAYSKLFGDQANIMSGMGTEDQRGVTNQQAQMDQYLRSLGMKDDRNQNYLNILSGRNPNVSNFDKYGMPLINTAIGVGGTLLKG